MQVDKPCDEAQDSGYQEQASEASKDVKEYLSVDICRGFAHDILSHLEATSGLR
jgi:hypothetical protein